MPDYFPLESQAQRVMEVEEKKVVGAETTLVTRAEVVETVRGTKEIPGIGRVWVVEAPLDSGRSINHYYVRRGDSVLMIVPGRGGRPTRVLYLLQPLRVGLWWYDSGEQREINEVISEETVSVPAGIFAGCFRLVQKNLRVASRVEKWLAPGVGLVKRVRYLAWLDDSVPHSILREERLIEYRVPNRSR